MGKPHIQLRTSTREGNFQEGYSSLQQTQWTALPGRERRMSRRTPPCMNSMHVIFIRPQLGDPAGNQGNDCCGDQSQKAVKGQPQPEWRKNTPDNRAKAGLSQAVLKVAVTYKWNVKRNGERGKRDDKGATARANPFQRISHIGKDF